MANNRPPHLPRIPETPRKIDSSIREIPSSVTPTNAAPRLRSILQETEGKRSSKVKIKTSMKSSFFKTEKALKDAQNSPNSEAGVAVPLIRAATDSRSPSAALSLPDSPSSVSVSSDSSLAAVTRTLDKFEVKSPKPVRLKWDSSNDEDEPNSDSLNNISDIKSSPLPQRTRTFNNLKRKKRMTIQSESDSDKEGSSQGESTSQAEGSDISSRSSNKKMRSQTLHIDGSNPPRPTLDLELEKKVDSLQLSFPSVSRAEITQALVRANGLRVKAASELIMRRYLKPTPTEAPTHIKSDSNKEAYRRPSDSQKLTMQKSIVPSRDSKVHVDKAEHHNPSQNLLRRRRVITVDSDSEDAMSTEDDSSEAASDTDFALDEQMKSDQQTVDFFNDSSCQDIQDITACNIEQAETIINELRPFRDMDDLQRKLKATKGLGERFINAHREMMQGYSAVDKLIDDIEKIGTRIEGVMQIWNSKEQGVEDQPAAKDEVIKIAMEGHLHGQPELMSSEITLKSYQVFGVNWILLLYRMKLSGILADEMGLGKTAQVIGFLAQLVSQGKTGPHLVVVPSSTLENWLREFQKFCPALDVRSYFGNQVERRRLRHDLREDTSWSVLVTTYQMATGAEQDRKFLRKTKFDATILDEGHMVKNCTSARYHHLMAIPSSFRLLLTGTPLQNNLQELVSLLTFILPSMFKDNQEELAKIFKIRQTVKDKKDPPKSMQTKAPVASTNIAQMLSMERIKRAKKIMTPFVLRRQKSQVYTDLPAKLHVLKRCPMSERQAAVYKKVVEDSKKSLKSPENKSDDDTDIVDDINASEDTPASKPSKAVNILMDLRKAAIHPLLLRSIYTDDILQKMSKAIMREEQYWNSEEKFIFEDMSVMTDFELHKLCLAHRTIKQWALSNDEIMDSGKVQVLEQLLIELKEKGDRVLVFSQFTMMLDVLEEVLGKMGFRYSRLDGSSKVDTRQDLIDDFSADPDITVFLLSTKAGGFGINLTAANRSTVILYDLDPNPHNDKQAEDRAHRVGQARDVTVIRLVSENTVEENIFQMAEVKLRLDQSVSFGRESEEEDDADGEPNLKALVESALHI